ncbi:ABC transporter ATP-binding protein [Janibacter alkaliphilus]|uniref:Putative ABC transport system ATP-binding protein n=1 Tax=Janibacter alkaliphilus TaxID=1069963 RepID=A0A852X7P2_9MICO|nr:ABC transporter ATP-binding protein [Janibacter alkaliphilus]NYG36793.1 putative ABC transport system ATP-binding protein [Janibacter alkaliphilus]
MSTTPATHQPLATSPEPTAGPQLAAQAHGLTKVFGRDGSGVTALDHVDVGFAAGRFTAIMGPSGSGKSTLMHCLAGLERPTEGRILIGGTDATALSEKQLTILRRERIGFVFQSFNLLPMLTAEQNVLLPLTLAGRRADRDWFDHVVGVLGIGDRLSHRPAELSGGQQQRVATARALVTRPDVLFADEPTGALDSRSSAELLDFLRTSVRELGQSVVMVTHDPRAASYADRVVLLADGRITDEIDAPSEDSVLDAMRRLGA